MLAQTLNPDPKTIIDPNLKSECSLEPLTLTQSQALAHVLLLALSSEPNPAGLSPLTQS